MVVYYYKEEKRFFGGRESEFLPIYNIKITKKKEKTKRRFLDVVDKKRENTTNSFS